MITKTSKESLLLASNSPKHSTKICGNVEMFVMNPGSNSY